jgi:hypothetical protein
MKKWINRILATLVAGSACAAAQAATYYVSDCGTGATLGCVAGSDSNAGTSAAAPWQSTTNVRTRFSTFAAGDKVLFAKGGAWNNANLQELQNFSSSAASPITFDSYAPSWGGTAKPILVQAGDGAAVFSFDEGGTTPHADGGYVVQNLDLRGNGTGGYGFWIARLASDITLTNLDLSGFGSGLTCLDGVSRVKLTNSTLTNNRGSGIFSACNNALYENLAFDNNGYGQGNYDHPVYFSGHYAVDVKLRNNTFVNSSHVGGNSCTNVIVVVHGIIDGVLIENNLMKENSGSAGLGCWGIAVDTGYGYDQDTGDSGAESFQNVVIRGNTIVNAAGIGIGCSGCVSPLIENNVIVVESTPDMIGISVPDRPRQDVDAVDTGATIRNNTIYYARTPAYSGGIAFTFQNNSTDPRYTAGNNVKVASNLIYFGDVGGSSSNNHRCFDFTSMSIANFTTFDNNLCYHAAGNGSYSFQHANLAAAQGAGYDQHGLSSNPLVNAPTSANGWSVTLQSTSTAINAGHATASATTDKTGATRTGVADIGAYEYTGGSSCTASGPAWVRIASEYGAFTVPSTNLTRFGNTTGWVQKTVTNSGYCTNGYYGGTPPTTAKWCELQNNWTAPTWIAVAQEYQMFYITGTQSVRFGNASGWTTKTYTGSGGCTVASFGVDPAPGVKRCEIVVQPASCSP